MTAIEARAKLLTVPDGMPVFVLLGSDPCATSAILEWISASRLSGVSEEKVDRALVALGEMVKYQPKKLPD